MIRRFAESVALFLARFTPKADRVVLRAYPSFEDSILAVYQALQRRTAMQIVWICTGGDLNAPIEIDGRTVLVRAGGLKDVYYSLTSRYLFITHGHFLRRMAPNQICINLWHGVPLKRVGRLFGGEGRADTYAIATSDFTRSAYADAFGMPEDLVKVTGQARTDRLIGVDKVETWGAMFPQEPPPKSLLLWLPTYRDTHTAGERIDGEAFGNVFNCSDFSADAFNQFLVEKEAICLIKPHPMAKRHNVENLSNVRFIDEEWLSERRLSLYQILGACDTLISDISSVIVDFLLLDRPILLLFEDFEAYGSSRGFTFEPIEEYLPGHVAGDFHQFLNDLKNVLEGRDEYAERRKSLMNLYFAHPAGGASDRILDLAFSDRDSCR